MRNPSRQQIRETLAAEYLVELAAYNPLATPSRTFTNATATGTYAGNVMQSARGAAADEHFKYASCGFKAQIVRAF